MEFKGAISIMKEITKCEGLKHQVKAYERIFDTVRVVDPVTKKLLYIKMVKIFTIIWPAIQAG